VILEDQVDRSFDVVDFYIAVTPADIEVTNGYTDLLCMAIHRIPPIIFYVDITQVVDRFFLCLHGQFVETV
jgi:hypothetical protein